jgi:hypothetical protein
MLYQKVEDGLPIAVQITAAILLDQHGNAHRAFYGLLAGYLDVMPGEDLPFLIFGRTKATLLAVDEEVVRARRGG